MTRIRRHHLLGLVSLVAWAAFGTAAVGANQTVNVGTDNLGNDRTLSPNSGNAAINTGETITWSWVGPAGDTGHIIESLPGQLEQWDSDPGTGQAENHNVGDIFPHTFTNVGAFDYHCRIHPDRMFGTITVTGLPIAAFTMTPPAATIGQRVDFDGMGSTDVGGIIMLSEWDLDGNGTFETSGATPNRIYSNAGSVSVSLRVTDNAGGTDIETKTLVVGAAAPPPPPPPPPSAPAPAFVLSTPLLLAPPATARLTVTAAARQRGADTRGVTMSARCDLACIVTTTGSIAWPGGKKIALTKVTKALTAAQPLKLVLVVPKKSRAALQRLFKSGKTATATIVLTTAQGVSVKKTVKLAR